MLLRFLIPLVCLLIFFALALPVAVIKAPTVDEPVHVLRGRVLWQTGNMRFQFEHGTLAHWLIGLFFFTEPTLADVTRLPSWSTGDRITVARELLWQDNHPNLDRTFFLARLPIIFAGLLLGAILARWMRERISVSDRPPQLSQLLVMVLFTFSPNLLASFTLATTDAILVVAFGAVLFGWWRYWRRPSRDRWLFVVVTLGLALAAKMTALILLPVLLIVGYEQWQPDPSQWRRSRWWTPALAWLSLLPGAAVILWGLYGFEIGPVAGLAFPVPAATYFNSLSTVLTHVNEGHQSFLLGSRSMEGWWHYFLVAFLVKTPVPTLLLLAAAVVLLLRQRRWRPTIDLWLPAVSLLGLATYSRLNIGYRHILPFLVFVWLLAAAAIPFWYKNRRTQVFLAVIMGWYVVGSLRQRPHYLAYFNELAGGPAQGYRYLADSNLDWGQDLKLLADFINQAGRDMYYSYFGVAVPAYYGIAQPPLTARQGEPLNFAPANPAPGLYALSVSHLQGMGLTDPDTFDWFRRREPAGNLGYSIFIYEVEHSDLGEWVAYCADPAPLLAPPDAVQLLGQVSLRNVYFDCRNSWVVPDDGRPGWYILPRRESEAWFIGRAFPDHFHRMFTHAPGLLGPSYDIYYWDGEVQIAEALAGSTGAVSLPGERSANLPVLVGDTAQLIAYRVEEGTWSTIWQVQSATAESLTVAGHLYTDASTPTVADGLGYTSEQWQPGDVFIQHHTFDSTLSGRFLETGLYNYLTGERLEFAGSGRSGTFIRLWPVD
ncbi:MAG TPA: hypothetical protein VF177_21140 [Anaerolineae bacterium]